MEISFQYISYKKMTLLRHLAHTSYGPVVLWEKRIWIATNALLRKSMLQHCVDMLHNQYAYKKSIAQTYAISLCETKTNLGNDIWNYVHRLATHTHTHVLKSPFQFANTRILTIYKHTSHIKFMWMDIWCTSYRKTMFPPYVNRLTAHASYKKIAFTLQAWITHTNTHTDTETFSYEKSTIPQHVNIVCDQHICQDK